MRKNFLIAPDGFIFIAPLLALFLIAVYLHAGIIAGILLLLLAFVVWFFRNPSRHIPTAEDAIVSPADGLVIKIAEEEENDFLREKCQVVCIFMNVFNVHVNRNIVSGIVEAVKYHPGKFLVASLDKASSLNERNSVLIKHNNGMRFVVVQIAGLVARRIACWIKEGDTLVKGERFGLIRFGSRLDIYLPLNIEVSVKIGDKVCAGTSIIGRLNND